MSKIEYEDVPSTTSVGGTLLLVPKDILTTSQLFDFLRHGLNLPDYFSNNWDSLEECFGDMSWYGGTELIIFHNEIPLAHLPLLAKTYIDILQEAEPPTTSVRLSAVFRSVLKDKIERLIGMAV